YQGSRVDCGSTPDLYSEIHLPKFWTPGKPSPPARTSSDHLKLRRPIRAPHRATLLDKGGRLTTPNVGVSPCPGALTAAPPACALPTPPSAAPAAAPACPTPATACAPAARCARRCAAVAGPRAAPPPPAGRRGRRCGRP